MTQPTPDSGPVDSPPTDGLWRDWDGAQHDQDVVDAGNALGLSVVDYIEDESGEVRVL